MPSRKAKKETKKASPSPSNAASHAVRTEMERSKLVEWLERNDPLYDRSETPPITLTELLSTKLNHRTFIRGNACETPYNWEKFRSVLEARTSTSPRWFMQVREEDLLIDGGLEGVTVDCFVIAEACVPTLAPAYYIVKQHMPFSDLEDNAPERILPIEDQCMCWRRVVRDNGTCINAYLLQKRESGSTAISAASFGFGAAPPPNSTTSTSNSSAVAPPSGFSFGFGAAAPPAPPPNSTTSTSNSSAVAPPSGFSFGFGAAAPPAPPPNSTTSTNNSAAANSSISPFMNTVAPLKPGEVLFALWSKKRLAEMAKSLKSGSRIVREGFKLGTGDNSVKLVMQNDLHDDVGATAQHLVLKMFSRRCAKIVEVDRWMDNCPVYEERLAAALQKFRANYVREVAEKDPAFRALYQEHHEAIEAELGRIVEMRKEIVRRELSCIENIIRLLDEKKLAEKKSFRLLKYYAANDVIKFRPFGKVSGISEMGEFADVCDPPVPAIVNAFNTPAASS